MKKTISIVLVLALGLAAEVAKADFTFGDPTNLGPPVNRSANDWGPSVSADGLELYFSSTRSGGFGYSDLWVSTRATTEDQWGIPVNLGSTVNSSAEDHSPSISADGLELYFTSQHSGGSGFNDVWVSRRATTDDDWGIPVNLGSTFNGPGDDRSPCISSDGLELYYDSYRTGAELWWARRATIDSPWGTPAALKPRLLGGQPTISSDGLACVCIAGPGFVEYGDFDLWIVRRATTEDDWGVPVNLGPTVNGPGGEYEPALSHDGSTLYFTSNRSGGYGNWDTWQVSIDPVVDLNGDGIVDALDICIMADHWHTDYQLCDIGPMPWGDGIVDVQDLIVLVEHLFEGIPPVELEDVNVDEDDDGSQVELEQGQILVVTLESNPTTGYRWEVAEIQESILEQMGEAEFKPSQTGEPPIVGAGGWEIFRFKAISAGQMTLQLVYRRPWEEGVEPINTFSIEVVVN